jgi:hypothetical protein
MSTHEHNAGAEAAQPSESVARSSEPPRPGVSPIYFGYGHFEQVEAGNSDLEPANRRGRHGLKRFGLSFNHGRCAPSRA